VSNKKYPELTNAIEAAGYRTVTFATEVLGIQYQVFRYRVRHGKLHLEDLWKILHHTRKSFDELFPNPHQIKPKPINLTLSPKPRLTPPVERMVPEPKPAPAPLVQPVLESYEPVVIDVYGGGLPPVE